MASAESTNMNGITVETLSQAAKRVLKIQKPAASNVTESHQKSISQLLEQLAPNADEKADRSDTSSPDTSFVCNGIADKAVTPTTKSTTLVDSLSEVVNSGVTTSSVANVVFLSSSTTTVPKNVDPPKNAKLYVLNGNVLKEVNDVDKVNMDKVNYVCVTANNLGTVIKKIQSESAGKNGKTPSSPGGEADDEKPKLPSTGPTFIQLSHPSLKSGNQPKIAFTVSPTIVTKPPANNCDILRSKLLAIPSTADQPTLKAKGDDKSAVVTSSSTKKETVSESPAVARARSELVRCRKALIEAAIHPQLPTYAPPAYYTGPTYTCEECEDTFSSPEGLNNHKNRRSVLFTYACPVCKKTVEFYSRCMFLLHVRSHDVAVKACFLTISIIPASKLNFPVLDGQLHRNEVEPVPLFDPASDRTVSGASSHQIVPIYRKRKAKSPVRTNSDDRPPDVDEIGSVNQMETSGSSTDDVAAETADSSLRTDSPAADEATVVTHPATRARRKRSSSSLQTQPVLKPAKVKKSVNCATTNCTSTTTVAPSSLNVDPSASPMPSPNPPVPSKELSPAAKLPTSCATSPLDEIHLTSSDEDEPAPPEEPKNHWIPCRECHQEVPSLTSHYRAANRPLREYLCEQCKFLNPSACALAAHVRMHTRTVPYICPDCGFYFSTQESFVTHVKQVCFYDFKTIRFKCPECSLLKPSVPLFIEHLKQCHIREVFKCSVCITSSYSARIIQTHMERAHPEATPNVLQGYRCMLCPNVLVAKQSINVHVKKHVFGLQHLRYVYICKFCQKYASSRMTKFEAHYHSCMDRARDPSLCHKGAKKLQPVPTGKSPEKPVALTEKDPLSVEEWEADRLKADFGPKTKCCVMCRTTKLNEHSKSLFCNACVSYVNAPDSNSSQVDGVSPDGAEKVEGGFGGRSKRKLKCKLCKQLLNRDWSTITNHYLKDHHADFDASKVVAKTKVPEDTAATAPVSRKRRSSAVKQEPAAANQTSANSSTVPTTNLITACTTTTANLVPTKVPKVECKYRCVKCGFSTNVRNDFHEHIVSHKTQSNVNYQCLECGECFIVKPSLEKHLIVVHKVRDIVEYDKDNKIVGGGCDDDIDEESKEKAVAENQCEVCYMQCDSKQQYDRHIRTHGMAFVAMQSRAKS